MQHHLTCSRHGTRDVASVSTCSRTNFQKNVIGILGEFLSSGMKSDGFRICMVQYIGSVASSCVIHLPVRKRQKGSVEAKPHLTNFFRELFQDRVHHG